MKTGLLTFISLTLLATFPAQAIETAAKQAFLIDMNTHAVLLNKDGDIEMHPSSMSKLMTVYILFDRLKEGRVKLDSKFTISEKAWRTQGSKTFVKVGDEIAIEDLIHGIIIQSGNDACVVVAEGVSGSEDAFVEEMNRYAQKLGLTKSHFMNATGLPDDKHLMSARDLATLAEHLITDFPDYYHYFSLPEYTYSGITQQNRNRLLKSTIGVDGLKTGHTDAGGYGITLSAKQGDRRLILVVNGLDSDDARVQEGDQLLRYGFREFEDKTIAKKGEKIADADVWMGKQPNVTLVSDRDLTLTLPASQKDAMTFTVKYNGPITAPIEQGAHVADLVVTIPGQQEPETVPLVAGEKVEKISGFKKLWANFNYFVLRRQP